MSGKRICFISLAAYGYFEGDEPTGGSRQFHLASTHLTEAFDVHFVIGDYGQPQIIKREGVTLHRAYQPDRTASAVQRIQQLVTLYRTLQRADADVYIVTCLPRKLAVLKPVLTTLGKPVVFYVATDASVEIPTRGVTGVRRWLYRWSIKNSTAVIAQTQYQKNQLKKNWRVKSTVIPNGYPPATVIDMPDSREYIIWVGRLNEQVKRPHLFLDVAKAIPDEQFLLIGPTEKQTDYTDRVVERASNLENVQYIGPVAPSKVHSYFQRAIAVINTSTYEGFPNTFIEAWRYATPVVSLDVDPGRFLDVAGDSPGYAGGEHSTLVSLTERLSTQPTFRRELGIRGLQTFMNRYQMSSVVEQYRELLNKKTS